MYNNIQSRVRIVIGLIIAVFILFTLWYTAAQISKIGKIPVDIETSPENATVTINGKNTHTGINYLKEGTYTFTATKPGYDTASQTATVSKINNYIALIPNPVSNQVKNEANSTEEAMRAESIAGMAAAASGAALQSDNPIIKKLPYSDLSGPFKIDYGYNQDNQSSLYLLVSYTTPDSRQKAIKWLKSNGVDLTTREILFSDFNNPATEGVDHD